MAGGSPHGAFRNTQKMQSIGERATFGIDYAIAVMRADGGLSFFVKCRCRSVEQPVFIQEGTYVGVRHSQRCDQQRA